MNGQTNVTRRAPARRSTCLIAILALLLLTGSGVMARAQIGSGWIQYYPATTLQQENSVGYSSYAKADGVETFKLWQNPKRPRQRCEIRVNDDYTSGTTQFEGEFFMVKFDGTAPGNDVCIAQVWLSMMMSLSGDQGGSMHQHGKAVADHLIGRWVRMNVIHDATNNQGEVWLDGVKVWSGKTKKSKVFYHKYGLYNEAGKNPEIKWKNIKFFKGGSTTAPGVNASAGDDGWSEMAAILKRIMPPAFPARDFSITGFGAVGDGRKDCHEAFVQAIAACTKAGGGRVVVPPGVFLSDGPIHLASNVNLHLSEGATIKFGVDPARYLPIVPTRFEGTLLLGHSPRIYARGATNVAITGKGVIDGNGRATLDFMKSKPRGGSGTLRKMGRDGVPLDRRVFGEGKWLRPSMIQPFECTNVLIEGVTVHDSPFWCVHPVFCRNVTVRGITVESMNGNNDGVDPDSCADVLIENCTLRTGDDSIAIKSGRDLDGRTVARPSENIVIRNVLMGSRHSGLCIGSEMSGGVRNVFMEDCKLETVSTALYFKGNLDRGGLVEHVRARRVHAQSVRDGLVRFQTDYRAGDLLGGHFPPSFRDYVIEDVSAQESRSYGFSIEGLPEVPIRDVTIRRARVVKAGKPYRLVEARNIRLEGVEVNGQVLPSSPAPTPKSAAQPKAAAKPKNKAKQKPGAPPKP